MTVIGVAIAIPEPWGQRLQALRVSFGDAAAGSIPTHITLVPPTDIEDPVDVVESHLADVAATHQRFTLRLRGTATFRPVSPVVFVCVVEGISSCELLANEARQGPLKQELTFPYHPHVTVAHHLSEAALDQAYQTLGDFDCSFEVDSFGLYVHGVDGVWRSIRAYRLAGQLPACADGSRSPASGT
ncbi:MAG: 2'-5' RNA ligase family protein [Nocardioidaceae bacterium]